MSGADINNFDLNNDNNSAKKNQNAYTEFIKEYSNNVYDEKDFKEKSDDKNLDDTMRFYQEESVSGSVQKLFVSNNSETTKIKKVLDQSIVEMDKNKSDEFLASKKEIDSFFDDMSETQSFDFGVKNHKKVKISFGKIFLNSLVIVFLCITVVLLYKIKVLNKNIDLMALEINEHKNIKKQLEIALSENENMKKIIEELGNQNNNTSQENITQTQNLVAAENNIKKYIVQRGDTLSSISQKFYGNENSYHKIIDTNHLSSENLSEGQELVIS